MQNFRSGRFGDHLKLAGNIFSMSVLLAACSTPGGRPAGDGEPLKLTEATITRTGPNIAHVVLATNQKEVYALDAWFPDQRIVYQTCTTYLKHITATSTGAGTTSTTAEPGEVCAGVTFKIEDLGGGNMGGYRISYQIEGLRNLASMEIGSGTIQLPTVDRLSDERVFASLPLNEPVSFLPSITISRRD